MRSHAFFSGECMRPGHVPGQQIRQKQAIINQNKDPPAQNRLHFPGCFDPLCKCAVACTRLNGTVWDRMGQERKAGEELGARGREQGIRDEMEKVIPRNSFILYPSTPDSPNSPLLAPCSSRPSYGLVFAGLVWMSILPAVRRKVIALAAVKISMHGSSRAKQTRR